MSGDVQPRKRKDKKKKKDELGIEDPRGTAAVLGEGDVFIHSQQDHGTGGHWCAKIIFFSLLAVLITLIGLIILENRGLTELEANAVESKYSGVLEGWIEDTPDDDHHDEHTLDLKHHDDEGGEDHNNVESDHEDEDHEDEDQEDESQEENTEADEDEDEENIGSNEEEEQGDDNNDNESEENLEEDDNEDEDEQENNSEEDDNEEIEKIEKEIIDQDDESEEVLGNRNTDKDAIDQESEDGSEEANDDDGNDIQSLEDDDDEPPLERITAPTAGKPFVEIEDETIEKPVNTLAEEEEYEKQQEEIRKEKEAQGTQIWLKLAVGGALLVATHAVLRRATAPRDDVPETEEHSREETPTVDRRMTLVPEQYSPTVVEKSPVTQVAHQIEEEIFKKPVTKSTSVVIKDSEEEDVKVKKVLVEEKTPEVQTKDDEEKELYSDEEVEDDEEEEDDVEEPVKENIQKKVVPAPEQKPTEESEPEDVEIIDDEQIEEELEEEDDEDEEEISDVDDADLLTRLEAKYGRLPEPERFGQKQHKDGGNSVEDDWPGEPSEPFWRGELDIAEDELRQGAWTSCEKRVNVAALADSARARWLAARALDLTAEAKRDNRILTQAIAAYLHLLKMNERLSDKKLLEISQRTIDRIQFRGTYLNAEPIYRLLIRRFPDNVSYRNNLTVSFLMANRADLADEVLKETLNIWPNDRVALAHHGFVLKNQYNKLEEAVILLYRALEGDAGPANEPRFYYHLGDALLLLGRLEEAHEVHKRGAALGHFLSAAQRSLYNVPRLKGLPWWPVEETPYKKLARALERSWRDILKEGEAAKAVFEKEKEGLKDRGEWSQLDLFVRGSEIPGRCDRAPVTCSIVRGEAAAAGCRRGQVKFSAMEPGTHVRPHVGPTNCRLRMHLGLSNTKETYIRVDKETRQWQAGKTFIFDDSFEHEVWHNGTGTRLVLIVDVWHPDLTAAERRSLPAI